MKYIIFIAAFLFCNVAFAYDNQHQGSLSHFRQKEVHANPDHYSFIVLGDTHITKYYYNRLYNNTYFKKMWIKANVMSPKPLFVFLCGDVVHPGTDENFQTYKSIVKRYSKRIPIFSVPGNHDTDKNSTHTKILYQKYAGPTNFAIRSNKLKLNLVGLDNSTYTLSNQQINFMKSNFKKGYTNFSFMHIPPRKIVQWTELFRWTFTIGATDLLSMKNMSTMFFGHLHLFDIGEINHKDYVITGGGGGPLEAFSESKSNFHHFVLVNVDNGVVTYKVIKL